MDDRDDDKQVRAMAEKYFHSRGAASHEEGRFDSAIRYFRKALALEDLPYTRLHLGLAYLGKNDVVRALAEMTRAIRLAPSEPEYYYQRGKVWRIIGDTVKADEDRIAAVRLDPNYERIEAIREAAAGLQAAFGRREESAMPDEAAVKDRALGELLLEADSLDTARRTAVEDRSCLVACPAYCCHFKGEPVLHGLWIGPWKLQAVRRFLKEKALREGEFVEKLPFGPEQERLRLIPPHVVVKDGAGRVVFYPKTSNRPLAPSLARALPRTIDYRELAWITTEARACAFLKKRGCMIHDLGGEPALPACKEFLCLTGYIFLVLDWLGLPVGDRAKTRSMKDLNRFAVEALLSLHTRLYGNDRLKDVERKMDAALNAARNADARSNAGLVADMIGGYRDLEAGHRRLFSRQKKLLGEDLSKLLGEPAPG
jgi:hypothetical protein